MLDAYSIFLIEWFALSALIYLFIKNFVMDPLVLGAIISGVVSLASTAGNYVHSKKATQREHQKQLDQWHRQNEYNSPLEQRKRFQEAGMNPSAVTGEVASGATAGALSSVPSDDYAKSGILPQTSIVDTLKSFAEIENIATNTDSVTSDIALKALEYILKESGITGSELENMKKRLEVERMKEENKWTSQNIEAKINNILADTRYKNTMSDDIIATQSARVDKLSAESDLIRAHKLLSEANTEESKIRASNLYIDCLLKQAEIRYKDVLTTNATNEEARNQALFIIEEDAKSLLRDGIITENQLKRYEAELKSLRAKEILDFDDFMKALRNSWLSMIQFD